MEITPLPQEHEIEVVGYYTDGSATTYRAIPVYIDGMEVELEGEGSLNLSTDEWIYVVATEDKLTISTDDPDDTE